MFASLGLLVTSSSGMFSFIWVLDSRSSHYMSSDSLSFVFLSLTSSMSVMIVDGTLLPLFGIGSIIAPHLSLPYIYYIPNFTLNLIFIG